MTDHISPERLHAALDGLLSSAELADVRAHVDVCEPCRHEYARLSEVVSGIRALPNRGATPEGLWAAIESRIETTTRADAEGANPSETPVIALPTAPAAAAGASASRLTVSWVQLAVAAALVAAVSAGTMWFALQGPSARRIAATPQEVVLGGAAARAVSLEDTRYVDTVTQLEMILEEGRELLDSETLVTIEESLRTVNAAIAEIEDALADDPNSALLSRLLTNHQRTKLGVLQRAVDAVQAQA